MSLLAARKDQFPTDVILSDAITADSLRPLITGEALILRVPRFASDELCIRVSEKLQNVGYEDYRNAPSVGRIGMSFFETGGKRELMDHFYKTALPNIHLFRDACAPYSSPIDVLRCTLDEIWPLGANLQSVSGRKMFVGLSRNMRPGTPLLAHHDIFARLAPDEPEAHDLIRQFAANIYVDVPEVGGELVMWKNEITDASFLERRGEKYGMDLDDLGPPDIVVKPERGDFIIFNARKMHAVAAGSGSDRLTLSCFVGYRGEDRPLTFWS